MTDALDRFLKAQEYTYLTAFREIRAGRKESHWLTIVLDGRERRYHGVSCGTQLWSCEKHEETKDLQVSSEINVS